MMLRKEYDDIAGHVCKQMHEGFYRGLELSGAGAIYILRDLAIKCQSIADEEIGENLKLIQSNAQRHNTAAAEQKSALNPAENKMLKLIQSNPYVLSQFSHIWAEGFEAGQKSMLAPASVTGRWWQSGDRKVWFVRQEDYKNYKRAMDINPDVSGWLTEEETREFE